MEKPFLDDYQANKLANIFLKLMKKAAIYKSPSNAIIQHGVDQMASVAKQECDVEYTGGSSGITWKRISKPVLVKDDDGPTKETAPQSSSELPN